MNVKTILVSALLTVGIGISMTATADDLDKLKSAVVGKAKSFANDFAESSIESMFDRTEVTIEGFEGSKPTFSILTTQPITESEDLKHTTFWQGSLFSNDGRE